MKSPIRASRAPRAPRAPRALVSLTRLLAIAIVLSTALTIVGPASHPKAAAAQTTAEYMEGLLVKWVNDARANRGIPRLMVGTKLTDLAIYRAKTMASNNKLAHPSCLGCLLTKWGITWHTCAEVIGSTTYPWGYQAALSIYRAWRGSSGHWSILMSRSYTRFGIGVAYRSSNHTTFAAAVLAG
jgi:uncharacterized protein YkwD